jgi:hypothetical protein
MPEDPKKFSLIDAANVVLAGQVLFAVLATGAAWVAGIPDPWFGLLVGGVLILTIAPMLKRAFKEARRKEWARMALSSVACVVVACSLVYASLQHVKLTKVGTGTTEPTASGVTATKIAEPSPPIQPAAPSPTTSIEPPPQEAKPKPTPPKKRSMKAAPKVTSEESPSEPAQKPTQSGESQGPMIQQQGNDNRAAIGDNNILGDNVIIPSPPPRRLTGGKLTELKAELRSLPKPRVAISKYENTIEGKVFGDDICSMLKDIGWIEATECDDIPIPSPQRSGLWIFTKDPNNLPESAIALRNALKGAGVDVQIGRYVRGDPNRDFLLEIGPRE